MDSVRRNRKAKVVATLGPASSSKEMIEKLSRAGADVFRINMSHTDHARLNALVEMIRGVEEKVGRPIGILADLQGPKLRVGTFAEDSAMLENGATFTLDSDTAAGDGLEAFWDRGGVLAGDRLFVAAWPFAGFFAAASAATAASRSATAASRSDKAASRRPKASAKAEASSPSVWPMPPSC